MYFSKDKKNRILEPQTIQCSILNSNNILLFLTITRIKFKYVIIIRYEDFPQKKGIQLSKSKPNKTPVILITL